MQLPKRKPGKYTQRDFDPHITQAKFDELSEQLRKLKAKKRPAAAEVRRTAANGDFSENAEYQQAKGRLRGINRRIDILENQLKRAVIIKAGKGDKVALGSSVTVAVSGKEKTYTILGSSETDPSKGIVSQSSPIGSVLMGAKVGEVVLLERGERSIEYKILAIN